MKPRSRSRVIRGAALNPYRHAHRTRIRRTNIAGYRGWGCSRARTAESITFSAPLYIAMLPQVVGRSFLRLR
jgi:hypothetical protein